jgi:hypothetical protein
MTEDLAPFFADFAVACTVNGAAVRGIFDNGFALGAVGIGMAGTQPTLRLRTADVTADPVGQAVSVNAVAYTVAAHEPDGTGVSVLMLERA